MTPEDQHRAVEMYMGQAAECDEPAVGTIVLQEMTMMNGTPTSIGRRQVMDVCESHLFLFLDLFLPPETVENFKKWYSVKQQERKPARAERK